MLAVFRLYLQKYEPIRANLKGSNLHRKIIT